MPRADFPYSTAGGNSVYPIKEGYVFKLVKARNRKNPKMRIKADHDVFIWIQRIGKDPKRQPKDRPVSVVFYFIPRMTGCKDKYILQKKTVQFESITKQLKNDGFKVVAKGIQYNYTRYAYKRFYHAIDAI